jgi:hypothetical protein
MACQGDSSLLCGGPNALTLYQATDLTGLTQTVPSSGNYKFQGCYVEQTSGRALKDASTSSSSMTVDTCIQYCASKSMAWAGVEYGKECYCSNSIAANIASPANDPVSGGCNMPCAGNNTQFCGGSSRLSVYQASVQIKVVSTSQKASKATAQANVQTKVASTTSKTTVKLKTTVKKTTSAKKSSKTSKKSKKAHIDLTEF